MIKPILALILLGGMSAVGAETKSITDWCVSLQKELTTNLKWRQTVCREGKAGVEWQQDGNTAQGWPLVYAEFGDLKGKKPNTTLVLSMVHSDEITPLFIAIELSNLLRDNPGMSQNSRVIVAPLVNPDGFFRNPRIRMNSRGVDINRNFDTKDWDAQAQAQWKKKFKSDPRRNPGSQGGSEEETQFQKRLIAKFKPDKILSIHSPLNHLDYDGPNTLAVDRFSQDYVKSCLSLRSQLKAVATGFFPGSLGNYAGQELGIPTLTLELPTANPRKARVYWNQFRGGIETMIHFKMPEDPAVANKP